MKRRNFVTAVLAALGVGVISKANRGRKLGQPPPAPPIGNWRVNHDWDQLSAYQRAVNQMRAKHLEKIAEEIRRMYG